QNRFAKNLRLYVVVSHPQTHKIIFSGSAEVSATAPQASHAPKIGGSGREPGGPAADMTLRPDGDVTGIYEAFSDSGQRVGADIPELMVQLNQAGHAVAGWFTRPEEKVVWQDHLRIERP